MKLTTRFLLAAFAVAAATPSFGASGPANASFDPMKFVPREASNQTSLFESRRARQINELNKRLENSFSTTADLRLDGAAEYPTPITAGPASMTGDIDGPDGQLWYYTADYVIKSVPVNPYFTDKIMLEYKFDIYDADRKFMGSVHDKVRYTSDEVCIPMPGGLQIVPIVTRNFFNNDEKYEIMISLAVNTTTPGTNHYRTVVYSLNGEKESLPVEDTTTGQDVTKEFDKPVFVFNSTIADVLDASTPGKETLYITCIEEERDPNYNYEDFGNLSGEDFWNAISNQFANIIVYDKVENGSMHEVYRQKIRTYSTQGDQQDTPLLISFGKNGSFYYLFPYYKETFYNPYYSNEDDLTQRENNTFVVDLVKISNGVSSLVKRTEIPMEKSTDPNAYFTYYSVGDLRYRDDILMKEQENAPNYIVTTMDLDKSLSTLGKSFTIFDAEGKKVTKLFEGADSSIALSDIEGFNPMQMFVSIKDGDYTFNMVDLTDGKVETVIPSLYSVDSSSDPERLLANLDRVKAGDSFQYAIEMRNTVINDNEEDVMRILWTDRQGKFVNIERLPLGTSVIYAQSNLSNAVLDPHFINTDDVREYMVLVKRGTPGLNQQEEFMVVQPENPAAPDGKTILHCTPCEKGILSGIVPFPDPKKPRLIVYYLKSNDEGNDLYTQDVYLLPFGGSAVEEIGEAGTATGILFDGATLTAEGEIAVYNLQGVKVASGINNLDVTPLDGGLYIAVAGDKIYKFAIR